MKFKEYLNEGINDTGIFKACFMGGSPASGKSYSISKIKGGSVGVRVVNTDTMTEFLAKKYGKKTWGENWNIFKEKIKRTTEKQLILYLNSLLPLFIDGTSSSPSSVFKREGILKSIGYDTSMVWINTSLDTAIERNKKRDRTVDVDFLIKVYKDSQKLKDYYKTHFSPFLEINNDDGELTEEIIVKSYKKMNSFFNSNIENPIGIEIKEHMIENGYKYLIDNPKYDMQYLNKLVSNWYRV